jgi:hypothetical protein
MEESQPKRRAIAFSEKSTEIDDVPANITPAGQLLENYLELCTPQERQVKLSGLTEQEFITTRVNAYNQTKYDSLDQGDDMGLAEEKAREVLLSGLEDIEETLTELETEVESTEVESFDTTAGIGNQEEAGLYE